MAPNRRVNGFRAILFLAYFTKQSGLAVANYLYVKRDIAHGRARSHGTSREGR